MLNILYTIIRFIVAAVFIFSGFVKLVDPSGTAYKIQDYLETIHLGLPLWLAMLGSVTLGTTELVLGLNAAFKVCYERTTRLLLFVVMFFTGLTLYVAIADPVQDCGCFGDALVISNWATFFKNVVLLVFSIVMFRSRYYLRSRIMQDSQNLMTACFIVLALVVSVNAIRHLPFIDFRPYAVGVDLVEQMKVPEGMPQDVYQTTFVYEQDGVEQEFTEDDYPWQDSTWTYVSSENVLVSKGAEPAIHDFAIANDAMGDITQDVLMDDRYTFLLVAPYLDKASYKHNDEIEDLMAYCDEQNFPFLVLTSTTGEAVAQYKEQFSFDFEVYAMDEITLKTMIRSNPGLVIIKDGVVLAKYHHNDLPVFDGQTKPVSLILRQAEKRNNHLKVLLLVLVLAGIAFKLSKRKDFNK